jgi:hypothetical protein
MGYTPFDVSTEKLTAKLKLYISCAYKFIMDYNAESKIDGKTDPREARQTAPG